MSNEMDHINMRLPIIRLNKKDVPFMFAILFATDLWMLSEFSGPVQVVVPDVRNLRDGIGRHYGICRISCYTCA